MIQTDFKLKEKFEFIKENLTVLVILPAFIGGLWQVFELTNISYAYIRFFSVSQMVADGILILFVGILSSITFLIQIFLNIIFGRTNDSTSDDTPPTKKQIKRYFIICCCIYVFGLLYFGLQYIFFEYKQFKDGSLFNDVLVVILTTYVLSSLLNLWYINTTSFLKEFTSILNLLLVVYYGLIFFYFCKTIHSSFILNDKLANIENIQSMIKVKYPSKENEILYFNDKFIFLKTFDKKVIDSSTNKPIEKIHILNFDKLFEDSF